MQGIKKRSVLRLLAALVAVMLPLSAMSACGDAEEDSDDDDAAATLEQVLSDPWYYTSDEPVEFEQEVSAEFQKDGGFEYEKAQAQKFFEGKKVKVAKSARNEFVKENGMSVFDKSSGTGVFLVSDPAFSGMSHHGFYLEYTSDKGKKWKIRDGAYYDSAYPKEIKLAGDRVYIIMCSEPAMKSYILYSDDLCQTFRIRDVITLLPDYAELMYCHTANVEIVDFNAEDGSMTLGWYDSEYVQETGGDAVNFFLTASFNGELTEGTVVSADDEYIQRTAETIGNNDEIDG